MGRKETDPHTVHELLDHVATCAPDRVALIAASGGSADSYKVPRHVRLVDELPRNPMGRVLKAILRERES
jgi:acyl-CoA synthetase (AMP-forming)/AMP-acid ligase II